MKVKSLSCVRLFVTPWTAAHQAPQSMGFPRQEHWSGAPLPSPAANADRVSVCCTCHFQSSSPFFVPFGLLSLQVSSVSNFHPDTGGEGGRLFGLTCSVVLRGGRNTANKYHWRVWGVLAVSGPHWVCHPPTRPAHSVCAFWVYTAQVPGCSAGELSKVGPGLHALPRSKLFRFRFSGTPHRCRLSWA